MAWMLLPRVKHVKEFSLFNECAFELSAEVPSEICKGGRNVRECQCLGSHRVRDCPGPHLLFELQEESGRREVSVTARRGLSKHKPARERGRGTHCGGSGLAPEGWGGGLWSEREER